MILHALLLVLAVPSPAQTVSLEDSTAVVATIIPTADELAARLRTGTPEERLAALADASSRLGGLDWTGQRTVVTAMREQAESAFAPAAVRARAYLVLGERLTWLKDDALKGEAIATMLDALEAAPGDARADYRRAALRGLWPASKSFPFANTTLEDRAANALLAVVETSEGADRTLAFLALGDLLKSRLGLASIARVGSRLRTSLLEPIASNTTGFSTDGRRDVDERVAAVRALAHFAWGCGDSSERMRVRMALTDISQQDPNATVRFNAQTLLQTIRP